MASSMLFSLMCTNLGDTISSINHVFTFNLIKKKYRPHPHRIKVNIDEDYIRRGWSDLPDELIEIILNNSDITDRFRMSMVCTSWASVFKNRKHDIQLLNPQVPWLQLLHRTKQSFYDMSNGRIHDLKLGERIQDPICYGSSKGWMIMLQITLPLGNQLYLFNPVSGACHKLPCLKKVIQSFWKNLLEPFWSPNLGGFNGGIKLSSEDPRSCIVASIITHTKPYQIAFCKLGDPHWSIFQDSALEADNVESLEILFSKDQKTVYVMKKVSEDDEHMMSVSTHSFRVMGYELCLKIIPIPLNNQMFQEYYEDERMDEHTVIFRQVPTIHFVEFDNDQLLMIIRLIDQSVSMLNNGDNNEGPYDYSKTVLRYNSVRGFEIYLLRADEGISSMTKLTSLGNKTIFCSGTGLSMVEAINCNGFKENCIYFLEDYLNSTHGRKNYPYVSRESGIYHVEDGRIDRCFPSLILPMRHMYWFTPNCF